MANMIQKSFILIMDFKGNYETHKPCNIYPSAVFIRFCLFFNLDIVWNRRAIKTGCAVMVIPISFSVCVSSLGIKLVRTIQYSKYFKQALLHFSFCTGFLSWEQGRNLKEGFCHKMEGNHGDFTPCLDPKMKRQLLFHWQFK
jgi:hypothetical protein